MLLPVKTKVDFLFKTHNMRTINSAKLHTLKVMTWKSLCDNWLNINHRICSSKVGQFAAPKNVFTVQNMHKRGRIKIQNSKIVIAASAVDNDQETWQVELDYTLCNIITLCLTLASHMIYCHFIFISNQCVILLVIKSNSCTWVHHLTS